MRCHLLTFIACVAAAHLCFWLPCLHACSTGRCKVVLTAALSSPTHLLLLLLRWRQELANDSRSDVTRLLKQMAIQGQSVIVASGDCGSRVDNGTECLPDTGVTFPASSGYVTAVGGTTPTLYFGDQWAKEVGQPDSGGGHSSVFQLPECQQDVPTLVNRTFRNLPDVALAADPDVWPYEVLLPEVNWTTTGGTAAAASVWAGYFALVNQCRRQSQVTPERIGVPNTYLYSIGNSIHNHSAAFHDAVQGSNGAYTAGPGWDAVTGWGSMNGKNLMGMLCPGYVSGLQYSRYDSCMFTCKYLHPIACRQLHGVLYRVICEACVLSLV